MMKTDNAPIKMSWDRFIENDQTERKMSPFEKMNIQVADMSTNTDISLHSLEKSLIFLSPCNQQRDLQNIGKISVHRKQEQQNKKNYREK